MNKKMKHTVIVADPISSAAIEKLKNENDITVIETHADGSEAFQAALPDADGVIVRSETKITAEVFVRAKRLKVVGRAGVGIDNIDLDAATDRGVIVMNTPGGNSLAAAELAFSHLLLTARPVFQAAASMVEGKWARKDFSGSELNGKALAIFGCGKIGTEVARRADAFGMRVIGYDPFLTEDRAKALGIEKMDMDEALKAADFISLHLPLTDETKGFINSETLSKVRPGVRLVNCARGEIVNEADLLDALENGTVAAAGLDVFETEPLPKESRLRQHPRVVLTPHLGASTQEAQENVGHQIVTAVADALRGQTVQNALNMPSLDAKTLRAVGPYLKLGETLGHFLQAISGKGAVEFRITYLGKLVEFDSNLLTRTLQKGYLRGIGGREVNLVNAPTKLKSLGISTRTVKSDEDSDFSELIRVETRDAKGTVLATVEGTPMGKGRKPRIVGIDGREIEVVPKGELLLLRNDDKPGMIAKIGGILGDSGINIGSMVLSRDAGGDALTVLTLDGEVSGDVVNKLICADGLRQVTRIDCR